MNDFTPSDKLADFVRRGFLHVLEKGPYGSPQWRKDLTIYPTDEELLDRAKYQIVEAVQGLLDSEEYVPSIAQALLHRVCIAPGEDDAFLALLLKELKAWRPHAMLND